MKYVKNKKVSTCKFFAIFCLFAIPFFVLLQFKLLLLITKQRLMKVLK